MASILIGGGSLHENVMRFIVSTLALTSAFALAYPALAKSKVCGQFTITVTVVRPCSINDSLEVSLERNGKSSARCRSTAAWTSPRYKA